MFTFAQKPDRKAKLSKYTLSVQPHFGKRREVISIHESRSISGDRMAGASRNPAHKVPGFDYDFSRVPIHAKGEREQLLFPPQTALTISNKCVQGGECERDGLVESKDTAGNQSGDAASPQPQTPPVSPAPAPTPAPGPAPTPAPSPSPAPAPAPGPAAPVKKKAGVDSFVVKWAKNTLSGETVAKLRLDYSIKFKKDATYDPAVAEFRQNMTSKFEITAGPHAGFKDEKTPMQDDHYSRADDMGGHATTDVDFVSNDNPGGSPLHKDDVVDYTFTAEQTVIDTADGNKEVAKRGPHTGTIAGKHPRAFGGVPDTLS